MTDELRSSPPAILSPNLLRRTWQMIFFSNLVVFSREREVLLPLAMMLVLFFFLFTPEPPPAAGRLFHSPHPRTPRPPHNRDVGVTPCIMYYYKGIGVPLNAVNGPVLVHYLVVLTGLQTS
jgi:hypothetical protein